MAYSYEELKKASKKMKQFSKALEEDTAAYAGYLENTVREITEEVKEIFEEEEINTNYMNMLQKVFSPNNVLYGLGKGLTDSPISFVISRLVDPKKAKEELLLSSTEKVEEYLDEFYTTMANSILSAIVSVPYVDSATKEDIIDYLNEEMDRAYRKDVKKIQKENLTGDLSSLLKGTIIPMSYAVKSNLDLMDELTDYVAKKHKWAEPWLRDTIYSAITTGMTQALTEIYTDLVETAERFLEVEIIDDLEKKNHRNTKGSVYGATATSIIWKNKQLKGSAEALEYLADFRKKHEEKFFKRVLEGAKEVEEPLKREIGKRPVKAVGKSVYNDGLPEGIVTSFYESATPSSLMVFDKNGAHMALDAIKEKNYDYFRDIYAKQLVEVLEASYIMPTQVFLSTLAVFGIEDLTNRLREVIGRMAGEEAIKTTEIFDRIGVEYNGIGKTSGEIAMIISAKMHRDLVKNKKRLTKELAETLRYIGIGGKNVAEELIDPIYENVDNLAVEVFTGNVEPFYELVAKKYIEKKIAKKKEQSIYY